jgi:hypothetical protein
MPRASGVFVSPPGETLGGLSATRLGHMALPINYVLMRSTWPQPGGASDRGNSRRDHLDGDFAQLVIRSFEMNFTPDTLTLFSALASPVQARCKLPDEGV